MSVMDVFIRKVYNGTTTCLSRFVDDILFPLLMYEGRRDPAAAAAVASSHIVIKNNNKR